MLTIDYLNSISAKLCKEYNIPTLPVIYCRTKGNNLAQFSERHWTIEISPFVDFTDEELEEIVWHEFRHAWQLINYTGVYRWWLDSGEKRKAHYDKYYSEPLNSLEEDARIFSITKGKKSGEHLLKMFNPQVLLMLENQKLLKRTNELLVGKFGRILDKD